MDKVVQVLDDALDDYNLSNPTQMKLVFFRDAIEHVTRIKRILRQPRGNAMLVGVGGSGKQSLTRTACHMAGVELFQIELVRGYGLNEFREDLKSIMLRSGVQGVPIAFLFGDTQIVLIWSGITLLANNVHKDHRLQHSGSRSRHRSGWGRRHVDRQRRVVGVQKTRNYT
jgi:hypothetical protein